jgi:hypothetical protein
MESYKEDGRVEVIVPKGPARPYLLIPAVFVPPLVAVFAGYGAHEMQPRMSIPVHMATFWAGVLAGTIFFWLAFPSEHGFAKVALGIFFGVLMALLSAFVGYGFVSARYQIAF